MNNVASRVGLLLSLGAFLFTLGCASKPKVDWDSRIGSYTFDQAVIDLGPPDKSTTLADGTAVAEWITGRKSSMSFSFGVGSYGSHGGVGVGQTVTPDRGLKILRLVFDPQGKLKTWTKT